MIKTFLFLKEARVEGTENVAKTGTETISGSCLQGTICKRAAGEN